jgi:hypothetical protein
MNGFDAKIIFDGINSSPADQRHTTAASFKKSIDWLFQRKYIKPVS